MTTSVADTLRQYGTYYVHLGPSADDWYPLTDECCVQATADGTKALERHVLEVHPERLKPAEASNTP